MDELISAIEVNLTDDELTRVLVIAQYALYHPEMRNKIIRHLGLTEEECFALAHNVTEIVGQE